jgi:hypothetical protein
MAGSVWGQRTSDEQFVQMLVAEAHKIRARAIERLQRPDASLEWKLRARKSLGLAQGRLEALELEYDPETPYAVAMRGAFEAGLEAVKRLQDSSASPERMVEAAQAFGLAMGWFEILDLRHDPDAPGAMQVCNLWLLLCLAWESALRTATGPADRRETRPAAPATGRRETGQSRGAGRARGAHD